VSEGRKAPDYESGSRKQSVMEATTPFDASEYLDEPRIQAELLSDALATGKARVIAHALGTIARARGMSDIARATGLSRGSLYAALNEEGNPSLDTVMKVIGALKLELQAGAKDVAA
jgi:probable addiction module antidote protein